MKKSLITLSILCLLFFGSFAQTIRRVTKDVKVTGLNIYATVQAAHDAAVAGDIIYLEPMSAGHYGDLNCSKSLTFIGNGFAELNNNSETTPNPPLDGRYSTITNFNMMDGSQNSKLIGIRVSSAQSNVYVPNITIERCYIGGPFSYAIELRTTSPTITGSNLTVTKCRINGIIIVSNPYSSNQNLGSGCIITNNIFSAGGSNLANLNNCIIRNNIFNSGIVVATSVVSDNIFPFASGTSVSDYNTSNTNSISNNLTVDANGLPTGNNNINGATLSSIFESASPNSSTPDSGYKLKAASPAIGTGTGGIDMGAFGGTQPFILSGLPPIPIITYSTTSGVGNSSTPLSVSVTVRGNN